MLPTRIIPNNKLYVFDATNRVHGRLARAHCDRDTYAHVYMQERHRRKSPRGVHGWDFEELVSDGFQITGLHVLDVIYGRHTIIVFPDGAKLSIRIGSIVPCKPDSDQNQNGTTILFLSKKHHMQCRCSETPPLFRRETKFTTILAGCTHFL